MVLTRTGSIGLEVPAPDDELDLRVRSVERRAHRLAVQWRHMTPGNRAQLEENTTMLRHLVEELDDALGRR
jgi:hypothetical protein